MKIFYVIGFGVGLGSGYMFHTEEGLSIFSDCGVNGPVFARYNDTQSGPIPEEIFTEGMQAEIAEGEELTIRPTPKDLIFRVKDKEISAETKDALDRLFLKSSETEYQVRLQEKDKPWLLEVVGGFGDFSEERIGHLDAKLAYS